MVGRDNTPNACGVSDRDENNTFDLPAVTAVAKERFLNKSQCLNSSIVYNHIFSTHHCIITLPTRTAATTAAGGVGGVVVVCEGAE